MGRQRKLGLLAALVMAITSGACASAAGGSDRPAAAGDGTSLVVENNKWMDVVVYAVRSGRTERLGMVTSATSERFELPGWATFGSGDLQLLIDPIGSDHTFRTAAIPLTAGDALSLRVENHLPLSSLFIRSGR
ncbi:MAG: hypothetical protein ACRELX_00435 [Longimicrobiales bacterium]